MKQTAESKLPPLFTFFPEYLYKVSIKTAVLLSFIKGRQIHKRHKGQGCPRFSITFLQRLLNCSERQIQRCIAEAINKNLLKRWQYGKGSWYYATRKITSDKNGTKNVTPSTKNVTHLHSNNNSNTTPIEGDGGNLQANGNRFAATPIDGDGLPLARLCKKCKETIEDSRPNSVLCYKCDTIEKQTRLEKKSWLERNRTAFYAKLKTIQDKSSKQDALEDYFNDLYHHLEKKCRLTDGDVDYKKLFNRISESQTLEENEREYLLSRIQREYKGYQIKKGLPC